jgi:serpin B
MRSVFLGRRIMPHLATAVALGALLGSCAAPCRAAEAGTQGAAAEAVSHLGWQLLARSGDGNAIVSPVSVWQALAMTHAGASSTTAAEIAGVLGMPDDPQLIGDASAAMRIAFDEIRSDQIRLDIANRLWLQEGKPVAKAFTSLLEAKHAAAAGLLPFSSAPESARADINRWVADQTNDRITDLLPSGSITPLTRVVLTNAVFMKAAWATPFDKAQTQDEHFDLGEGVQIKVPFMHYEGSLRAGRFGAEGSEMLICELPYAGERLAMVLLVPCSPDPDVSDGVGSGLAQLQGSWLSELRESGALRRQTVRLALPKWTARKPLSLNKALADLGMRLAFDPAEADFSGIDGTRDLFVSDVVHEGFVEVSEEGTEAAAATGVVIGVKSLLPPAEPLEITADRPFLWAVIDTSTGSMLFAGTVCDPRG